MAICKTRPAVGPSPSPCTTAPPPSLLTSLTPSCFPSASLLSHPPHSFISIPPVHPWPAALLFYLIYPFNWKCDCYFTYLAPVFYFLFVPHSDSAPSAFPLCFATSFHKHTLINCVLFFTFLPHCHLAAILVWKRKRNLLCFHFKLNSWWAWFLFFLPEETNGTNNLCTAFAEMPLRG